jgi:hypothetical protein
LKSIWSFVRNLLLFRFYFFFLTPPSSGLRAWALRTPNIKRPYLTVLGLTVDPSTGAIVVMPDGDAHAPNLTTVAALNMATAAAASHKRPATATAATEADEAREQPPQRKPRLTA